MILDESVFRHEVSAMTGFNDGDSVTSLTEQVDSAVTSTCSNVTYVENSEQGAPGLRFLGTTASRAVFAAADLPSLYTATSSNELTTITVSKNTGTGTSGTIFASFSGGRGIRQVNSDSRIGDALAVTTVPVPNDELVVVICVYAPSYSGIGDLRRVWVNGTCAAVDNDAYDPLTSNTEDCSIGNIFNGYSPFEGDYYASYVIDRALDPQECMQVTKDIYDDLGISYPWDSAPYILAWLGDSITAGVGSGDGDENLTLGQQAAISTQLNIPYGYWHNLGIGGIDYQEMLDIVDTEIEWATEFYKKPVLVCTFEYHNQSGDPLKETRTRDYVDRLKLDQNVYVLLGTATDSSQYDSGDEIERQSYCTNIISDPGDADGVVSLHLNSKIGVDGSAQTNLGTYFSDSVHLNNDGYFVLADEEFVPAIQAFSVPSFIGGAGSSQLIIGINIGI
jgi:hypothetical protein